MKVRMTQKDLLFGVYRGAKGSLNPGLHIWFRGRYVWPRERKHGKRIEKTATLPFTEGEPNEPVRSVQ